LGPLLATKRMQRRGLDRGAGVTVDQVQLSNRHVQAVALGVLDLDVFVLLAAGLQRDQTAVAADAVVLVDDRRAFGQLAEVADDRLGLAADALAPTRLAGALGEQLAFGQRGQLRLVEHEAVVERRDRNREARQLPFSRVREKVPGGRMRALFARGGDFATGLALTPTLSRTRERG